MKTKKRMTALGAIIFFALVFAFNPIQAAQKEKYEEKFEKTVNLARDGKVIIDNVSGSIEIKTWNRAEVQIVADKTCRAATRNQAKENADLVKINVIQENSTVRIETEYPQEKKGKNKNLSESVYYKLMVPSEAAINATTHIGNVTCEDIGGYLRATTMSGNVVVSGARAGAACSSTGGDVEAMNVSGDVDLHTVSGTVKADSVKGSVEADTVSGNVLLTNITGAETVKGSTLSGRVVYEGDIASSGYYLLKSLSGRVEFTVPAGAAFDVNAKTFTGSIDTEFEITVRGKIDKKSLSGSINGGGAEVDLKTFSGNIYLKKK
jgi:hypothetical protein